MNDCFLLHKVTDKTSWKEKRGVFMSKSKKQAYVKWLVFSVMMSVFFLYAVVKAVDFQHSIPISETILLSFDQKFITEQVPFILTLKDEHPKGEIIQIELPSGLVYEREKTAQLSNEDGNITKKGRTLFIDWKNDEGKKEIKLVMSASKVGKYELFASTTEKERQTQSRSADLFVQSKETVSKKAVNTSLVMNVEKRSINIMQVESTTAFVSNWEEFLAAIADVNIAVINIGANITKTSGSPATINRNITINGNGNQIDFGTSRFELGSSGGQFTLNDVILTKKMNLALVDANGAWNILFHHVSTGPTNEGEVVYARDSTLHLTGENYLKSSGNTITVLHFITTAGANSYISTNQPTGLELETWALGINDGYRNGGTITVDQAQLTIHSENTPAIRLRWGGNLFTVKNQANVHVVTDSSDYNRATVNFSGNLGKDNTLEVLNQSVMKIEHLAGNSSALRINGDNLYANISGGSKLSLYNKGDGKPSDSSNVALELAGYGSFIVSGPKSQLNVIADNGPAVWGDEADTILQVGQGTEFIARGQTKSADVGIFNMARRAEISIDNPLLYDFSNTRVGGGNIFSITGSDGFFNATNSDVSVWTKGEDIYKDEPVKNWSLISFSLTGRDLATIQSSQYPDEFNSETFGSPNLYTRMSGNNARPIVDELQIPTDADKFIYGHITIPEGVDTLRDAWTDEVSVDVVVKNEDGSEAYRVTGLTVGEAVTSMEIQEMRNGMFKIPVPNGEFLQAGQTIEVEKAYRGGADPTSPRVHMTILEDIQVPVRTVIDITPPNPATNVLDKDKVANQTDITNATKRLAGTSDEPGSIVKLAINGQVLEQEAAVQTDGTWTFSLPYYLQKGDQVQVLLSDQAGAATELNDRPPTNQEIGNINPTSTLSYRDAIFEAGPVFIVKDILPTENTLVKSVSVDNEENMTKAGSILTYTIQVKNNKDALINTTWNDVFLKDVMANGLDINLSSIKVNGQPIDQSTITFQSDTRLLEIPIGDLQTQQEASITFEVMVTSKLIGQLVTNQAQATGKTIREETFIIGEPNLNAPKETITVDSNIVENPGGTIMEGALELFSAPTFAVFGSNLKIVSQDKIYPLSQLEGSLAVRDTRQNKNQWTLKAQMIEPLQTETGQTMRASLIYSNGGQATVINEHAVIVYQHANEDDYPFIISNTWSPDKDGLFLQVKAGEAYKGNINGTMRWILEDAP